MSTERKVGTVLFFVLAILMASYIAHPAYEVTFNWDNLLQNPSFEMGAEHDPLRTWWFDPSGGPYNNGFAEVKIPYFWNAWWEQDTDCSCCLGGEFKKGRPEVVLIDSTVDPNRIYDGDKALKMFTFWRCHEMGIFQRAYVEPGTYRFSIRAHAWCSNCSVLPYAPPLQQNCISPLDTQDRMSVGIALNGDVDPWGDIVWGSDVEQYGNYDRELSVMVEVSEPMTVTAWFRSESNWPTRHADVYLDHAVLARVHPVYLPLAVNE